MRNWSRDSLLTAAWLALIISAAAGPAIPLGDHVTMLVAAAGVIVLGLATSRPSRAQLEALLAWGWPLAAFCGTLLVTAAAGEVGSEAIQGLGKHLTPVVLVAAAAVSLGRLTLRWWVVVALLGIALVEVAVAIGQALHYSVDIMTVDLVTGTFGETKSGYVSVFMTGAALLAMAMALELRRRNRVYWALAGIFPLVAVLASGRAVVLLAPMAIGAMLLADLASRRPFEGRRRTATILGASLGFVLFLGTALEIAYPGSSERISTPARIADYLLEDEEADGQLRQGAQLTKSVELTIDEGIKTLALGAGPGTSEPGSPAGSVQIFDDDGRPRSRGDFNGVFAPRLIIESGLVGLLAWLLVVAWSVWLAERARSSIARGGLNAVVVRAMPGLAVLALLASFYHAGPFAPPLELFFWVFLGINLRFVALGTAVAAQPSDRWDFTEIGKRLLHRARGYLSASPRAWALAIAAVALVARLPLILNDFTSAITPDSPGYIAIADGFLDGNWFDTGGFRTWGYPLFIAPLTLLPGSTTSSVVLTQHALGVGLAVVVFLIGDRYFGRATGLAAGGLVALAAPMMLVEHYVLPDLLFGIFALAGAVALIEAATPRPILPRMLILSGALFAMATYTKPSGQVLAVAAPIVLLFATRSWRESLRGTLVVAGTMVLFIAPLVIYNGVRYGEPTVSIQGGQSLWLRVFDQDKLPIPTDSADGRLANRIYRDYLREPLPAGFADPRQLETTESYSYVFNVLTGRGMSPAEATDIQFDLAMEAIRSHPREYAEGTIENVLDFVRLNRGRAGFDVHKGVVQGHLDQTNLPGLERLTTRSWRLGDLLAGALSVVSAWMLAIAALPFVGSRRSRVAAVGFGTVWLVLALGGSLTNYVEARFAAQIAPMQWLLEAAAATMIATAVFGLVRGKLTPTRRNT